MHSAAADWILSLLLFEQVNVESIILITKFENLIAS